MRFLPTIFAAALLAAPASASGLIGCGCNNVNGPSIGSYGGSITYSSEVPSYSKLPGYAAWFESARQAKIADLKAESAARAGRTLHRRSPSNYRAR